MHRWLERLRIDSDMRFSEISFSESKEWELRDGVLGHITGGFFSVAGLKVTSCIPELNGWQQPIINQPEVGILGFLVADIEGVKHFLAQGKAEPGNVRRVQVAPTVQATYSNYTRKHGGSPTHYLEYFTEPEIELASDSLQSEQGTRFFRKFNRNVTAFVDKAPPACSPHFCWVSAREMREALLLDYTVNTDARSVLVSGPWSLLAQTGSPFENDEAGKALRGLLKTSYRRGAEGDILAMAQQRLGDLRAQVGLGTHLCGLNELEGWSVRDTAIEASSQPGPMLVKHYRVDAPEREKKEWDQPLVLSTNVDEVVLVCQEQEGVLKFLLSPSIEVGLSGGVEFGPSYKRESAARKTTWLADMIDKSLLQERASIRQSDEGGRFMQACCSYRVLEAPASLSMDTHGRDGFWVTLAELECLCRAPGILTNEARSVVSLLLAFA